MLYSAIINLKDLLVLIFIIIITIHTSSVQNWTCMLRRTEEMWMKNMAYEFCSCSKYFIQAAANAKVLTKR